MNPDEITKEYFEEHESEVLKDLADKFTNNNPDEVLEKLDELGLDIDDLPL